MHRIVPLAISLALHCLILQKGTTFSRLNAFIYVGLSPWSLWPFSFMRIVFILWDSLQCRRQSRCVVKSDRPVFESLLSYLFPVRFGADCITLEAKFFQWKNLDSYTDFTGRLYVKNKPVYCSILQIISLVSHLSNP